MYSKQLFLPAFIVHAYIYIYKYIGGTVCLFECVNILLAGTLFYSTFRKNLFLFFFFSHLCFFSFLVQKGTCLGVHLPTSSASAGYETRSIFKVKFNGFSSEVFFSKKGCNNELKSYSLPHYLLKTKEGVVGYGNLFSKVLALREMQTALSRI